MYTATLPVHIKLRIKRKAVLSCLLPRLPLRVLPRPPLRSGFYCRDSNESFQRGSRDSLGCQMSDVSGLHTEVFFRDWREGRRMQKGRTFMKNIIQNIYMRTNGAFHLSRILEQGMASHSSWQRSILEVRKVRWRNLLLSFALLPHSHIWQHTAW